MCAKERTEVDVYVFLPQRARSLLMLFMQGNHAFLSEGSSQTFVNTKKQWSVSYGSGAASGELVTDTLVLGGMVLGNHSFGAAHSVSQEFFNDPNVDGLMVSSELYSSITSANTVHI